MACLTFLFFSIQSNRQMTVLRQHDIVVIRNCRPLSATKRFTLEKIMKSPETEHDLARARRLQHKEDSPQSSVFEAIKEKNS